MRMVFGLVLVFGIGLAGFAVYMANDYIAAYQNQLAVERANRPEVIPTKDVYVTTRALNYGEILRPDDVKPIRWPENALPEGVFHSADDLFPNDNAAPRTVLRRMETNEPLMVVKITEPGEDAGVSSRLAPGMRAFAIRVDVSTGVSGFLRPGDHVDVYWTGRNLARPELGEVTRLIQASIPLVAVDQIADNDRNNPTIARTVTVAVSPTEVAALAQAQSTGRLSLALVGSGEENLAQGIEVDQRALLGIDDTPVATVAPREVCSIRTRRGGEIVETEIPCTN